jgi:hypothetical protein
MKRKNYKEKMPEPKDYGGSDYSDDRCPSSWAAAGRDDNDLYYWEEVPKEPIPEGPNGSGDPDNDPFEEHLMCCVVCQHAISDLFVSVDECFQAMEEIWQRMKTWSA